MADGDQTVSDDISRRLKNQPPFDKPQEQAEETEEKTAEDVSERTKEQFEKLTESNKKLNEENKALRKNVLESLRPELQPQQPVPQPQQPVNPPVTTPNLTQNQVDDIYSKLIDQNGYVDVEVFKKTLEDANKKAEMALEEAKKAQEETKKAHEETKRLEERTAMDKRIYEENRTMQEIHSKYPRLDPENNEFDEKFYDAVRNELISQYVNGEKEDVARAAEKWSGILYLVSAKADKQKEQQKKQINSIGTGVKKTSPYANAEFEQIRQGTMHGVRGALAERLRRAGQ